MERAPTLFDRWIARPKRPWITLVVAVSCLVAPFAVAWAEGYLGDIAESGLWRDILVAPTIITYIFVVAPYQAVMESRVRASLKPLLAVDDAGLLESSGAWTSRNELAAFGAGVLVAITLSSQGLLSNFTWLGLTLLLEAALEYGLLGVVVYGTLISTRAMNELLRLPLRIDPLDVTPFEAIGRQSLMISLAFVGGVTLSLLFLGAHPEVFLQWQLYVIYAPLITVPVVVFFLSMAPTHRRLQAARDAELGRVQALIRRECSDLVQRLERGDETGSIAQRVSALAAYETRLMEARTWPYNTTMLRTVFASILIPGATMIGRILAELLKR